MTSVVLPEKLTAIGDYAFYFIDLKSVTSKAVNPLSLEGDNVFYDPAVLYTPAESVDAYAASDWAKYFSKIKAIEN